jgi:hypothetical protein
VIRFRADANEADKASVRATHRSHRKATLTGDSGIEKLAIDAGQDAEVAAAALRLDAHVEFAEPNYLVSDDDYRPSPASWSRPAGSTILKQEVADPFAPKWGAGNIAVPSLAAGHPALTPQNPNGPNDPEFASQWALANTGQTGGQSGSDINVVTAWQSTLGSNSTVIAVVDSGVVFSQWTNPTPSQDGDLHGWDYVTNSNVIQDAEGHGTAIAGIIAAEGNNSIGVTGVMWHASIMSLRVLDNTGTGDIATAVQAIDYARTHGARVINLSWGSDSNSRALREAIARAQLQGVVVVCSAGNNAQNLDAVPYYPASYQLPNLIAVAATDPIDQLASWSNYGQAVGLAARGVDVLTTQMGGGYAMVTGTSASTPLVSGVVGLLQTMAPNVDASTAVTSILNSVRQVSSLSGRVATGGVLNAGAALADINRNPGNSGGTGAGGGNGTGAGGGNGSGGNGTGSGSGNGSGNGQGNGNGGNRGRSPEFRSQGKSGRQGTAAKVSTGTPGRGLPNLTNIRRQRAEIPAASGTIHSDLACLDCGGGGGSGGGGSDPYFGTSRTQPRNTTGTPGVNPGSQNFIGNYR